MYAIKESNYDFEEESPCLMRRSTKGMGSFKAKLSSDYSV